eukprot:6213037-Pleurochrysis_carterae.AAC.2
MRRSWRKSSVTLRSSPKRLSTWPSTSEGRVLRAPPPWREPRAWHMWILWGVERGRDWRSVAEVAGRPPKNRTLPPRRSLADCGCRDGRYGGEDGSMRSPGVFPKACIVLSDVIADVLMMWQQAPPLCLGLADGESLMHVRIAYSS